MSYDPAICSVVVLIKVSISKKLHGNNSIDKYLNQFREKLMNGEEKKNHAKPQRGVEIPLRLHLCGLNTVADNPTSTYEDLFNFSLMKKTQEVKIVAYIDRCGGDGTMLCLLECYLS